MDKIRFGIEFEVCVCDYEADLDVRDDEYIHHLKEKFETKAAELSTDVTFIASPTQLFKHDYTSWLVSLDPTIECSKTQVEIDERHTGFRHLKLDKLCKFHSAEIISPITNYKPRDIQKFFQVYETILFQDNLVYEMNTSQGMHINISHPRQDPLKFLRFWWYFEPVILSFLPKERLDAVTHMARPLRRIFKTMEALEDNAGTYYRDGSSKFSAVSIKKDRFEIRVVDSNLIPQNIFMWLRLLTKLLYVSITEELDTDVEPDMASLFLLYINDKDVETYFRAKARGV
jgi:hypothetical protein